MSGNAGYRFLVITSELEQVDATPTHVLLRQIATLEGKGVICDLVIDPSQSELEERLACQTYDAILPVVHFSRGSPINNHKDEENYSIPLLIEQIGLNPIGCSHYVQLLTMDKTVSLRRSGCGVPGMILTRQMCDRSEFPDLRKMALDFPIFVKPNAMCASLGIDFDNIARSSDEIAIKAKKLFSRYSVMQEVRLERDMSHCRQFTVAITGNSPAFCTSIIELVFPPDIPRVYNRTQKDTRIEERDVRYELVSDKLLRDELEYYALRAFTHLGMRDYGRLDFFLEDEPLVHDINSHPTLGNSFSHEWARRHNVPVENLLAFPLAAFHFRQQADGQPTFLPSGVLDLLPPVLRSRLQEPAPVTAPPEYTRAHAGCLVPERFRAVDGTAVEIEVLRFLEALVGVVKPSRVLETGSFVGASAEAMARALMRHGEGKLTTLESDPSRAETTRARLFGLPAEVVNCSSLSYTPTDPIDLLFLDSHRAMREQEFRHFRPFLHRNSVIVWHDSADHHPGVPEALRSLRAEGILNFVQLPTPRGICLSTLRYDGVSAGTCHALEKLSPAPNID